MDELTKITITHDDRMRFYWLQQYLFIATGKKHSQQVTLSWLLDLAEGQINNSLQRQQANLQQYHKVSGE